jgi:NAD(P)-dependent dehydrogenase (short-subunit alcohol dehydrogenase family)
MTERHGIELFSLAGRTALVTGAAGHLGPSMANALAEAGAEVFLNGWNEVKLQALADKMTASGHKVHVAAFDVLDDDAVNGGFAAIGASVGRLDVLVNNANIDFPGDLESTGSDDFSKAYDICVTAAFRCLRAGRPFLRAAAELAGQSAVINIASMYGVVSPNQDVYGDSGENNPPSYGPPKAALIQFTRYAACHVAGDGIRVNAISPGPFPADAVGRENPEFIAALARKTPLSRVGKPDELKGALLFLASDASSYVTGTNLAVDGGWTAW